jgi:hypothetical protein
MQKPISVRQSADTEKSTSNSFDINMTLVTFRLLLLGLSLGILTWLQAISVRAGSQHRRTTAAAEVNRKSVPAQRPRGGGLSNNPEKNLPEKKRPEDKVPSQKLPDQKLHHERQMDL